MRPSGFEDAEGSASPARRKNRSSSPFPASEYSNHITGKLIHVNNDWKRLEREA
jgi:hypothetical protein